MPSEKVNLVLVGGGLANGLIALRLRARRPELTIRVVEQAATLGAGHTWSFFPTDLTAPQRDWVDPVIAHRWPRYEVRFPRRRRVLATAYATVTADRFDAALRDRLGAGTFRLGQAAVEVRPDRVVLNDGSVITAEAVIDGRGPEPAPELDVGFQKFVGREVALAAPHGLEGPIIMDATVPQRDGYRFIYVLPLDARRLLIEDTRYSDGPALDVAAFRTGIGHYAAQQGWKVEAVLREEEGVLPVALGGDIRAFWAARRDLPRVGLRAALFHPTTGYSLPDAVRLADRLVDMPELNSRSIAAMITSHSTALWRSRRFFRLLNRMLFRAAVPTQRYRVLERFYGLGEGLIARFYAGRLTIADRLRLLAGRPPVPIGAALRCLPDPAGRRRGRR